MPNNRYCVERQGDVWRVYFSERGQFTWERFCANEADACELLLSEVLADPTTR